MKISISVGGLFHAGYLAKYLYDNNELYQLVTSYPTSLISKRFGIDKKYIKSIIIKEVLERGYKKLFKKNAKINFYLAQLFDIITSFVIKKDADIYIIWSGYAYYTIKKIKKYNPNAIIVLERGSAHIKVQNDLLIETAGQSLTYKKNIIKETKEYNLADYIAVPSIFAMNSFIEEGISKKKLFLNNYGVDLIKFVSDTTVRNYNDDIFYVGYAGNMSKRKNVSGIINAVTALVNKGYNIKLKLVGNIDSSLPSNTFLGKKHIEYFNAVPQSNLPSFYNSIDLFVLNSIEDGFGMVLIQAMCCCLPVIATTNTGGPDIIDEGINGFIIPIRNDNLLANKIAYLYENRELCKKMGLNAAKKVIKGYSWSDYGERALKFYKHILNEK